MLPNETTNQALIRLGFRRTTHEAVGPVCDLLNPNRRPNVSGQKLCRGMTSGKHVERVSDGQVVRGLGCNAHVDDAIAWIAAGCPMEAP